MACTLDRGEKGKMCVTRSARHFAHGARARQQGEGEKHRAGEPTVQRQRQHSCGSLTCAHKNSPRKSLSVAMQAGTHVLPAAPLMATPREAFEGDRYIALSAVSVRHSCCTPGRCKALGERRHLAVGPSPAQTVRGAVRDTHGTGSRAHTHTAHTQRLCCRDSMASVRHRMTGVPCRGKKALIHAHRRELVWRRKVKPAVLKAGVSESRVGSGSVKVREQVPCVVRAFGGHTLLRRGSVYTGRTGRQRGGPHRVRRPAPLTRARAVSSRGGGHGGSGQRSTSHAVVTAPPKGPTQSTRAPRKQRRQQSSLQGKRRSTRRSHHAGAGAGALPPCSAVVVAGPAPRAAAPCGTRCGSAVSATTIMPALMANAVLAPMLCHTCAHAHTQNTTTIPP